MSNKKVNEFIRRFFHYDGFHWVRNRDGYKFSIEEAKLAIEHFIETGIEP